MSNEKTLDQLILEYVINNPGKKAREIANYFEIDKSEVNHYLYGPLNSFIKQDDKYCWYGLKNAPLSEKTEITGATTKLTNLCQYYLACLGQDDDGGVSAFASNNFNDFDYAELNNFPIDGSIENSEEVKKLASKVNKDKSRLEMYFGYPVFLRKKKSSKWEGFFVEPIFLFNVENQDGKLVLSQNFPILNRSVLKKFTNLDRNQILEELVQLEKELGLNCEKDIPELDDLVHRLQNIRPEWSWMEKINPDSLNKEKRLKNLDKEGIYNNGVVVVSPRSPYTQGLESELKLLSKISTDDYKSTALGAWVNGAVKDNNESEEDQLLLEVLPLNAEQKQAVQKSLISDLTVITGPPGTGKSQVVTNLLINSAWKGKKVLFVSKNNKAVDVVDIRVNNISNRPVMLRLGANEYQNKLAEYLIDLLSATCSENELADFCLNTKEYRLLENKILELNKEEDKFIELRNKTDELDRSIEEIRITLPIEAFQTLKNIDIPAFSKASEGLKEVVKLADKRRQFFPISLFWKFFEQNRINNLQQELNRLLPLIESLKIDFNEESATSILDYGYLVSKKIELYNYYAKKISDYSASLKYLKSYRSLEEISKERTEVSNSMAVSAKNLWCSWLKTRPSRISSNDRQLLNRYKTMLKMVLETKGNIYSSLGGRIYKEYLNLADKVSHLLPVWAVTSLSAKGKLPFVPGYFDIVIFDEASQCDIASALPLLFRAKRAVIIGDPKQLSHISGLQKGQDEKFLERFDLIPDYVNWAFSYNSLFDLASNFVESKNIVRLKDHHRSHADIIEFSNDEFYGGDLRIATNYDNLKFIDKKEGGIRWININGKTIRPSTGGAENNIEAERIVEELRELVIEKGYLGSIGVVTPFVAQASLIRKLVNDDLVLSEKLANNDFLIDTVHKFQGDERDVMIFSPVVSDNMPVGALGFLRNNGNLFNVAITRARAMLLVIGNLNSILNCDVSYLAHFAKYTQNLISKKEKKDNNLIVDYGPVYPKVLEPEKVSEWEHIFYEALYKEGIKLIPQFNVEKYTLDFALLKGEKRLDIEVDGERYHKDWTGDLCRRDQLRNQRLYELGWDVKRFWVYEIRDDMDNCIKVINEWLKMAN